MKILVTGHNGFIGTYLLKELKKHPFELLLYDKSTGIDICNWENLQQIESLDVVIHLANLSFVPASFANPKLFYETNFISTLNMLELCRKFNAKMIYFSSYVYGHPQYQPIDENHNLNAYNPYSQTKLISESVCEGYSRDFNIPVTVFRPFNIYGKGQKEDFLIPTIISQAENGKIVIKDEKPKRDYIHVTDVVKAVILALLKTESKPLFQTYNVGSGKSHSVREIVDIVRELSENEVEYECTNEIRQNEVMDTVANISKIKNNLNWTPTVSLVEGLKSMMK